MTGVFLKVQVMQTFGWLKRAAILAIVTFLALLNPSLAFCQGFAAFQSEVVETQEGASTEYNVINNSSNNIFGGDGPVDIVAFAVSSFSSGDDPSTTDPGWAAEALDAALWTQPMGRQRFGIADVAGLHWKGIHNGAI
jgi:hypothetical protein